MSFHCRYHFVDEGVNHKSWIVLNPELLKMMLLSPQVTMRAGSCGLLGYHHHSASDHFVVCAPQGSSGSTSLVVTRLCGAPSLTLHLDCDMAGCSMDLSVYLDMIDEKRQL